MNHTICFYAKLTLDLNLKVHLIRYFLSFNPIYTIFMNLMEFFTLWYQLLFPY